METDKKKQETKIAQLGQKQKKDDKPGLSGYLTVPIPQPGGWFWLAIQGVVGTVVPGMLSRNAVTVTHKTTKQKSKGMGLGTGKL